MPNSSPHSIDAGLAGTAPTPLAHHVGRLQRLAVFEAAARLGSFTAAGRELGISQPAVTRQVRLLEQSLGHALFVRTSNRSDLTDTGTVLADAIKLGFDHITRAVNELAKPTHAAFVLACHPGFAQQWLMPRIEQIQPVLEGRELRLWLVDRPSDLANGNYDAAIHVATTATRPNSLRLFGEVVVPVASPALATQLNLNAQSHPQALLDTPLLHMDEGDQPWLSWGGWFGHFGLTPPKQTGRVLFNNYPMVLQQTIAGRGVALGWHTLIDDLVSDGVLVPISQPVSTSNGYYLTWTDTAPLDALGALTTWLLSQFAG
jgi:LysR family transcriptional regulator, glycine cleavage system transcriptional activator